MEREIALFIAVFLAILDDCFSLLIRQLTENFLRSYSKKFYCEILNYIRNICTIYSTNTYLYERKYKIWTKRYEFKMYDFNFKQFDISKVWCNAVL